MSQEMRESIEMIKKVISTEISIAMKNEDAVMYQDNMRKIFPTFAQDYPILFKKLINNDDLSMLEPMLKSLDDVKSGKNPKVVTTNLSEQIAEKYLYPTMGRPTLPPEEPPLNSDKK
jgi:hypothetical protein